MNTIAELNAKLVLLNAELKTECELRTNARVIAELKEVYEYVLEERYCEMLDACESTVIVCGMSYNPSTVLASVDPIAFRCGFADWIDGECKDEAYIEINGEFYDYSEVKTIREECIELVESEIEEIENQIETLDLQ
jgi:hypothetical protein